MTVALVTGITGQDGFYLARHLAAEGTETWGLSRSGQIPNGLTGVHVAPAADLCDAQSLRRALVAVQPDEIYHLAAQSSVAASWEETGATIDVTATGTARLLDAMRAESPQARLFLASSCEIFGEPETSPQTAQTTIRPTTPYGAAKACAHYLGQMMRAQHGLHIAIGILYNHESPRRPESFVSRKITAAAAAIAAGSRQPLALGNLDSRRDWGDAESVARAMPLILRHPEPRDWIVATGQTHSVRDWCEIAFAHVGLDWRGHVVLDRAFWRPASVVPLVGDPTPLKAELGWQPGRSFPELVVHMVEADLARLGLQTAS